MKQLYLVSLGCAKNLVDSEVMLGLLEKQGYTVVREPEDADLLLVNTCGFIGSAVEEAIDEILALAEYKKQDQRKRLVVTGCLVQRYGGELARELPEVDLFIGTDGFQNIAELLGDEKTAAGFVPVEREPSFLMNSSLPRKVSTPAHRAYLKVTEGCSNRCSYCLIPSIRGPLRSRPIPDLLSEAKKLQGLGVKELTLVAQDLLAYGLDLQKDDNLQQLLQAILTETGIPWLRLLYLHPVRLRRDFLSFVADNPRILPYFDIPVQHCNDRILRLMNRPYGRERLDTILAAIHAIVPEAAVRTTLMVGFPGEGEDEFEELLEFLRISRFDHVGVFSYENEEGSMAENLPDHCSEEIKEERRCRLMEFQAEISLQLQQRYVGRIEKVLVEGLSRESDLLVEGRTRFQAAEIDGCVYITSGDTRQGEIVDVKITEAHHYDLLGEIFGPG